MKTKRFVKATVVAIGLCSVAHAGTYIWDGGTGGLNKDWSLAANWNPDGAPTEAGDVILVDPTTQSTSLVDSGLTYSGTHFNVTKLTIATGMTLEVNQKCLADEIVISGVVTIKGTAALDAKKITIGDENVATVATKQGTNTLTVDSTVSE